MQRFWKIHRDPFFCRAEAGVENTDVNRGLPDFPDVISIAENGFLECGPRATSPRSPRRTIRGARASLGERPWQMSTAAPQNAAETPSRAFRGGPARVCTTG